MTFNLQFQHQQQVAVAVERAKQITMAELNAVMQVGQGFLGVVLLYKSVCAEK